MNLNPYLQPYGAPVTQSTGDSVSPFDFGQNYSRNVITTTKVKNLSITNAKLANLSVGTANIISVLAQQILAGTIAVGLNLGTTVGGAYVLLDGANNRIIVNDGTTNRIVIGSV